MIPDLRRTLAATGRSRRALAMLLVLATAALVGTGCRQDMHDQPKYEPFEESDFFLDGQASRLPVAGTVARGTLREDAVLYTGLTPEGLPVQSVPIPLDRETLERGRVVYDIYCAPCHGATGAGNGMIVQRGFKRPESFHAARLRQSPPGYFFQVVSNGFGQMSSYAGQVGVTDRWAAIAYVRALQLSQAVPGDLLDERDRQELVRSTQAVDEGGPEPVSDDHGSAEEGH